MALVLQDRVREISTTTGTGTVTLSGAYPGGYRTFASCVPNSSTTYYCIHNTTNGVTDEWEVGLGTYSSNTLTRTTILSSSNAGSAVNFSAGDKEVFITYPAEKAIYEEADGKTLINAGPITVIGSNVTTYTSLNAALGEFYANINSFAQVYAQNQSNGAEASTDFVVENDNGTDTEFYGDFGINSSGFNSASYPIYTPNSGYMYSIGDSGSNTSTFFVGSGDGGVVIHAGGFNTNNTVAVFGTDLSTELKGALTVPGATTVNGTATFGSTVTLNANPTLALQAATKQYVDNQVTAGLHIHDPVRVETTGNLTATYAQGGTTFNITDITSTTTVTTSTTHGLSVNDQIWLTGTAGNGLSANTAYFVYSVPANNQLTLSLTFGGAQITGLTNAAGLTYPVRANSGVGATLTNSGAQAALTIDNVAMATTNRVMVRLQTNGAENGVYTVTDAGSGSTNWVLTRATDSNKVNPADPNGVGTGDYYFTQEGVINAGDSHVLTTEPNTMIIGYTPLTYTQFSGSVDYTGGTNINVSGQTISLTGTVAPTNGGTGVNTVTTGDLLYGSASNTWSKLAAGAQYKTLVMGASVPEWNALALNQSGAVSGNLPEAYGGTNNSTYVTGDILYASAANTLGKLSPNTTTSQKVLTQTGTGSAGQAPSWDNTLTGFTLTSTTLGGNLDTNGYNVIGGNFGGNQLVLPAGFGPTLQGLYEGNLFIKTGTTGAVNRTWTFLDSDGSFTSPGPVVASSFSGSGVNVTSLNASAINAGTIGNAYTTASSSNGASTIVARDASGNFTANVGTFTTITGAGSGITALNASNISSGTIPNANTTASASNGASTIVARDASGNFTANNVTAANIIAGGSFLTSLNASVLNSGTVPDARFPATLPAVSGANLTSLNASAIASGTVPTARLASGTANNTTYLRGDSTWAALSAPNNGTLTMNVSGTGLSGSATFTADQAGSSTFTVTSNASSSNGASTIVARDASGNFSAGTITATLNGNAGTVTNGLYTTGGQTVSARNTQSGSQTGTLLTATGSLGGLELQSAGSSAAAFMAFHRPSAYAAYFGIDTDNNFAVGGWSAGAALGLMKVGSLGVGTASSGTAGEIRATNNITAYYSDERLKTKIGSIENALEKVKQIETMVYHANETAVALGYDASIIEVGVTAQSVERVMPQTVAPAPIDDKYLTVRYERLVPLLIEAIKELEAQVAELKAK